MADPLDETARDGAGGEACYCEPDGGPCHACVIGAGALVREFDRHG